MFTLGDGYVYDGTELRLKDIPGDACISKCIEKKVSDDAINGVTVYAGKEPGCFCERGMTTVSNKDRNDRKFKTCLLPKGIPLTNLNLCPCLL